MKRFGGLFLFACCTTFGLAAEARAQSQPEWSLRLQQWAGHRSGSADESITNAEAWTRMRATISDQISICGEGWLAVDPVGSGKGNGDVREALIEVRTGDITLTIGRQINPWGRADRVNPTDLLSARDYRRLVEGEDENRLGQTTITVAIPLAGGKLSSIWMPEFRETRLPSSFDGLATRSVAPRQRDSFALRYERFGGVDLALTFAQAPDRTPWLSLIPLNGRAGLALQHPRLQMIGADLATNLGNFGIRFESALYAHDRFALSGLTDRVPRLAAVIGLDRSFPGQWLVIAQGILRTSRSVGPISPTQQLAARRNSNIHGTWDDTIFGATLSVRKTFAGDRGQAEVTGAWLSGGGAFLQARGSIKLSEQVRLQILGEQYSGSAQSYFGQLKPNRLLMIGLRAGY